MRRQQFSKCKITARFPRHQNTPTILTLHFSIYVVYRRMLINLSTVKITPLVHPFSHRQLELISQGECAIKAFIISYHNAIRQLSCNNHQAILQQSAHKHTLITTTLSQDNRHVSAI